MRNTLSGFANLPHGTLAHLLADLSPEEWRAMLTAAAETRCIACGQHDGCTCSEAVDAAKEVVWHQALGR